MFGNQDETEDPTIPSQDTGLLPHVLMALDAYNTPPVTPDPGANVAQLAPSALGFAPGMPNQVPAGSPLALQGGPAPMDLSLHADPSTPQQPGVGAPPPGPAPAPQGPGPQPQMPVQPAGPPPGPEDIAGSRAAQDNSITNFGATTAQAKQQELADQSAALGRQATVGEDFANKQIAADHEYQQARATAHAQAATETAQWATRMDELARKEPDPTRYWKNTDRFGKALWLLGMAFSSAGLIGDKDAGQRHNPVLKMLQEELTHDVSSQEKSNQRQMDVLKMKGDIMQRNQAQTLTDLKDDHSQAYLRLNALQQAAMLRAQALPPDSQARQAWLAGANKMAELKVGVMTTRANEAFTGYENRLSRASSEKVAGMHVAAQIQIANQTDKRDRDIAAMTNQRAYDLAEIEAKARVDAAAKGAKPGKAYTLSSNTGFRVTGADGKQLDEVTTDSPEVYKEIAKSARDATAQTVALKNLRRALTSSTWAGRLAKNDNELVSAIEEAAGPEAQKLNGGGRMTDADVVRGYKALFGVDPNSLVAMIKGGDKDAMTKLLDKRIQDLPNQAARDIEIASGMKLPPGARVAFTPDDSLVSPENKADTGTTELAKQGVTAARPHPTTPAEYRAALAKEEATGPGSVLPELPDILSTKITDLQNTAGHHLPEQVKSLHAAANKAISDWEQRQVETGTMSPNDVMRVHAIAEDARTRAKAVAEDETKAGDRRMKAAVDEFGLSGGINSITPAQATRALERVGVGLPTPAEVDDLIAAVKHRMAQTGNNLDTATDLLSGKASYDDLINKVKNARK